VVQPCSIALFNRTEPQLNLQVTGSVTDRVRASSSAAVGTCSISECPAAPLLLCCQVHRALYEGRFPVAVKMLTDPDLRCPDPETLRSFRCSAASSCSGTESLRLKACTCHVHCIQLSHHFPLQAGHAQLVSCSITVPARLLPAGRGITFV